MRRVQSGHTSSSGRALNEQRFANLIDRVSAGNDKKTRRKRKRNATYWGKPKAVLTKGFDAFSVKKTTVTIKGKKVISIEAVAPETGIHSRAWAEQIVPQTGFLTLPIEIRHRIYEFLLDDAAITNPRKKGTKYTTSDKTSTTIQTYNFLTQISRQTYVDVVGGGLLYHFARFAFSSTDTMTRYLACINPAHRNTIRKVDLSISLTKALPAIRPLSFTTLSSLPNLKSLKVTLSFTFNICTMSPVQQSFINTDRARMMEVQEQVVNKLKDVEPWRALKGLGDFHMAFEGNRSRGFHVRIYTHAHRRYWTQSWQDIFRDDDPKLLEVVEGIRKVVTRDR